MFSKQGQGKNKQMFVVIKFVMFHYLYDCVHMYFFFGFHVNLHVGNMDFWVKSIWIYNILYSEGTGCQGWYCVGLLKTQVSENFAF